MGPADGRQGRQVDQGGGNVRLLRGLPPVRLCRFQNLRRVHARGVCLVSIGGMANFLSHFVLAEYFADDHFGLVHSLINCSFDASTVTFTLLELITGGRVHPVAVPGHPWLGLVYLALTDRDVVSRAPVTAKEAHHQFGGGEDGFVRQSPRYGARLDEEAMATFGGKQLESARVPSRSPSGVCSRSAAPYWCSGPSRSRCCTTRTGRDASHAERLVQGSTLILISVALTRLKSE